MGTNTKASSPPLATEASSDANGMSECVHAAIIEGERQVFSECSGFSGIVNDVQNSREFSYNFPAGVLTFYTELNSPPGRFSDGLVMSDGRVSRSYYINRILLDGRELDLQEVLASDRRSRFRCYIIDNYTSVSCTMPDTTWVKYSQ